MYRNLSVFIDFPDYPEILLTLRLLVTRLHW